MVDNANKTLIYMIRHGEPAPEHIDLMYGQADVPLSDRGRRQSHALAERLAAIPFDAVYSSDLQRAAYLGDAIAEPRDMPVRRLREFRERSLGDFQGMTLEQLRERHPAEYEAWQADRIYYRFGGGGENFEDLQKRVVPAMLNLAAAFPGQRIALAIHAGPIRVTLGHALGMPLSHILNFTLDYACVSVLEFPGDGAAPRVKLVNG